MNRGAGKRVFKVPAVYLHLPEHEFPLPMLHQVPKEAAMTLELQSFASTMQLALGHLCVVHIDAEGVVSLLVPARSGAGETRTFTFLEPLEIIHSKITIDVVTWHSRWPGKSREAASMAAFSLRVQRAIETAEDWVTTLRMTPSGVVADL